MTQRATTSPSGTGAPVTQGGAGRALSDFSADWRVLLLAGMAVVVGTGGAFAAWVLVKLIALVTNLVWVEHLSTLPAVMAHVAQTSWMVWPPVLVVKTLRMVPPAARQDRLF